MWKCISIIKIIKSKCAQSQKMPPVTVYNTLLDYSYWYVNLTVLLCPSSCRWRIITITDLIRFVLPKLSIICSACQVSSIITMSQSPKWQPPGVCFVQQVVSIPKWLLLLLSLKKKSYMSVLPSGKLPPWKVFLITVIDQLVD